MKTDLPKLMRERKLDALLIIGPDGMGAANTAFTYFVGDAHVTMGYILIKQNGEMFLVHGAMERDEAAKTGMNLILRTSFDTPSLIKKHGGNRLMAEVDLIDALLKQTDTHGRVGFYGIEDAGKSFALLGAIQQNGVCQVVAEYENNVIQQAQKTKDAKEAELIRETCRLTEDVIAATKAFLQCHKVRGNTLVRADGLALTIADAKAFIRREVSARGLHMHDCIFAIGRDAGVPHSSGNPTDVIELGKTIVFDIFPSGPGGYHADITRTWCLGFAPPEVQRAYDQVMLVHGTMEREFNTTKWTWEFNEQACEMFDEMGHVTLMTDMKATSGYCHSLGHGFGLAVHESPSMSLKGLRADETLLPGTILCNEPGLYYPDLSSGNGGFGVRVEDDYWVNPTTLKLERLTEYDRSLVVAMA